MTFTHNAQIARPLDRVFELVNDDQQVKRWISGLEATLYPHSFDPACPVGTPFILRVREGRRLKDYDGVITSYEPPRRLGLRFGDSRFAMQVDYNLRPNECGTEVDYSARFYFTAWLSRLISRVFAGFTRRGMYRHINNLKALAESEPLPSMKAA